MLLNIFSAILWLSVLAGAFLLARHNVRANRADRRSAARLVAAFLAVEAAVWVVGAHHLPGLRDVNSFFRIFGNVLLQALFLWVLYLALEPYGRRFWPDGLLGWTRLFSGHVRDPRIGREILIGSALGGVLMVMDLLRATAPYLIGRPPGVPAAGAQVSALNGLGSLARVWSGQFYSSVQTALIIAMLFVVLRLIVRRTWVAALLGLALVTPALTQNVQAGHVVWMYALVQLGTMAIITFSIFRFGLLVTTVMILVGNVATIVPMIPNGPSWAALPGNLSIALVVAVAGFGFYAARAGQPLFGKLDMADG